jgi:probable addiction module antidote protein
MGIKTYPFEPEKYFTTATSQRFLLEDALSTGHPGYIADALGIIARARGMSDVAKEAGLTRAALYKGLTKNGDPKLSTVLSLLKTMGLELAVKKGRKAA